LSAAKAQAGRPAVWFSGPRIRYLLEITLAIRDHPFDVSEPAADSQEFARWLRRTLRPDDFASLPDDDVDALRRFAIGEEHPPGALLFHQGERPKSIFIIERGEVDLVHETESERLLVQVVGAGSSIGDLPVMLDTPYAYSAVARLPTTVLRFSLDTVRTLIEIQPHICFRWLRLLSRRLDRAHRRLVELAGKSAFEQVVHFLLHETEERRSATVEITQSDLAAALGLARQTISRVLGQLSGLGVVRTQRGRIDVIDRERLLNHVPGQ
jgi:CRP-like cAMP-binding protein